MVTVKNSHIFTVGLAHGVIQVARFGMFMGGPSNIMHAGLGGELPKTGSITVIEQINIKLIFRPVDPQRRINSGFDHA